MSNFENLNDNNAEFIEHPCKSLDKIIKPIKKDLGDFVVRRLLPSKKQQMVGPWIFFDHFGPVEFQPGKGIDVRPHPHINLATVTYLFEGEILHRDSLGNEQLIKPGAINLMIAGKGIVHSERESDAYRSQSHIQHGLQLWLALPEQDELVEPSFHHYDTSVIPNLMMNNVSVNVMMGEVFGVKSPVKTFAETIYFEAVMTSSDSLDLPEAEEIAVYVIEGQIEVDNQVIKQYEMTVLTPTKHARVNGLTESRIAVIGGEKLGKRYIEWNFVSSKEARIEQAKLDWVNKKFPKVPGDELEFIPLPN